MRCIWTLVLAALGLVGGGGHAATRDALLAGSTSVTSAQVEAEGGSALLTAGGAGRQHPQVVGHGDGRIHVIPALSAASVKNGGKLTVSAVVKAAAGVRAVVADLGGVESVTLRPTPANLGGVSPDGTVGLYTADWTAHGLEEKAYSVTLRVTDREGHVFEDRSLEFTDPLAGFSTLGSTAYPNNGMVRIGAAEMKGNEANCRCAVMDAAAGYVYVGTDTTPGIVLKVALGNGATAPTRVAALKLNTGENSLRSAVIDPASGYAYFGTGTSPGIVVKVALGSGANSPRRVGAVTLNPGENQLWCAVMDAANGFACFGTYTSPGLVVKVALGSGDTAPTRSSVLALSAGESQLASAVVDATAGYAYFGTDTSPGRVVKVALNGAAPPTRAGAVTFSTGENQLYCGAIDPGGGYAYFGTLTQPGRVVKVALGVAGALPTRVGAVALAAGENNPTTALMDAGHSYAYFSTDTNPGYVVKIGLNGTNNNPIRVGSLSVPSGYYNLDSGGIDTTNSYAYLGCVTSPGAVVKVALGTGAGLPTFTGAVTFALGEQNLSCATVDTVHGYAYFGSDTNPGVVVKVATGGGASPPSRVDYAKLLDSLECSLSSAVCDPAGGYAYFGVNYLPGVVKVALGSGNNPPKRDSALTYGTGDDSLICAAIDTAAGYAYFGAWSQPATIVKVALNGTNPPTVAATLTLNPGENYASSVVIDPGHGYAYFGTQTDPGYIVKVALGNGNSAPTRVGALALSPGEGWLICAAIDPAAGYAYFGGQDLNAGGTGKIVKVALGNGNSAPTRIGVLTLSPGENVPGSAVIDPVAGYAYFGTRTIPGMVVKVALNGSLTPTRVAALTLNSGENILRSGGGDGAGFAYFGTDSVPGYVVKVGLAQAGYVKATKLVLPDKAALTDVRFYSHAAVGHVRLAIYDDSPTKNLVWQSGSVTNTAAGAALVVPAASGTPSALALDPGTYWLAWQVDTTAAVPSYTAGVAGDGFYVGQAYGAFPGTLAPSTITTSAEKWTAYITYTLAPTKLVVTAVNGGVSPTMTWPFSVTVQTQDPTGAAEPVVLATDVTLSRGTGTGTLGGTLTATLPAGSSSVTFTNVTYDTAESGVILTATRMAGDTLTPGTSAPFAVQKRPPAPSAATPNRGTENGGTPVTIGGVDFATSGGLGVTFGGVAATGVTALSSTQIACVTGAHVPQVVDVVVTNPDGRTGTFSSGYQYLAPPPAISGVEPNIGAAGGAVTVAVSGSYFATSGTVTVSFGGTPATNVNVTGATRLLCQTPAHAPGPVDVQVTNPDQQSATGPGLFTYFVDYEGDVAPFPSLGDGNVSVADWVQIGRFAAGLDTAQPGLAFQKADCAPRDTKGDGDIGVADWVQAGRYAARVDEFQAVGGPSAPTP